MGANFLYQRPARFIYLDDVNDVNDVNDHILLQLFQVREKHEIWHRDKFRGGEFKLIGSHAKIDIRTISGRIFVLAIIFAYFTEFILFAFRYQRLL